MIAYGRLLVFLTLTLLLTAACTGQLKKPARRIDFYTLEYPAPRPSVKAPLPLVLGVQRFRVAPTYNTQKIVYRDRNFKRNTYQYHKWRAEPGDLVGYFLARDLKQAGIFKAVFALAHRKIGALVVFFRYKAVFAGGVGFSILLGNMLAPSLDLWIKRARAAGAGGK